MAFAEDLAEFMDVDTGFAENATYNGSTQVAGIYSAPAGDAFGIGAIVPEFICAAADVDADPRGKTLVLTAGTHTIREFTPDLTGRLLSLKLEKA